MRTAYRSLSNWMMTPSGLPRSERFRIWIPNLERRRMTFWNCILMAGSLRNGNESLSLLHWHLERLTVYRSDHCQRLKPSCAKVKWQMPLKDFVWPSVRSPFVSGRMCAARIARGQRIGAGTMFIGWMCRLESAGPHIDMPEAHYSVWTSTRNIWCNFLILPITPKISRETDREGEF